MSKKSKYFFIVCLFVLICSIFYTYYDTMILKRFEIFTSEDDIPSYPNFYQGIKDIIINYVQ